MEATLAETQEPTAAAGYPARGAAREVRKRSEKLSPDQFNLPLEDAELAQGVLEAAQEKAERHCKGPGGDAPQAARNRGHLPRICPGRAGDRARQHALSLRCGEMARIGEDVSERPGRDPRAVPVLVTRRPRYACRRCSQAVAQAHAPEHVVPGGLPTELFIAWIIVSKFGDHLPFYRQAEIFKRQGIDLDRGTLGNWVGRACFHLMRSSIT
ncbi:insertion sequence transposase protein (plasmid) [Frigidibacter mobilis]|uniref:Insertion sequence transposase protein n=1 Tax=Frigidibacter mobilis TaxID=1335048 RepID=A0A159Z9B1_9RHOB|nr:transposase [Frigidibacter mobilis]AMY72157.1 insertion sequence transposase protein [Frigidibacter mobilis]